MTSKIPLTDIGRFHEKVIDFLNRLSQVYPNEKEIGFYAEKYKALKQANPRLTLEKFMEILLPFEQQIADKNDTFFLDFQVEGVESEYLKIIYKIKALWQNEMSDATKETVWKYMQVFIVLGKRALKI